MSRATVVFQRIFLVVAVLMMASQAWAFPMKPDVKALIREAKQPQQHFVPARAGWNGPEESAAASTLNPTYEDLRREPTAAQRRAELVAAAMPDWRALAAILFCIVTIRSLRFRQVKACNARSTTLVPFPATITKSAEISEAA